MKYRCAECGENFNAVPDDYEHQADVDFNGVSFVQIMCDGEIKPVDIHGSLFDYCEASKRYVL